MVAVAVLEEWRFIMQESGAQCVVTDGTCMRLQWCVESWAVVMLWKFQVMLILDRDQGESGWMMSTVRDQIPH